LKAHCAKALPALFNHFKPFKIFTSTVFEGSLINSKWITNGTEKEIKATAEYKCIKLIEITEKSSGSNESSKKDWPLRIKVSRISNRLVILKASKV
jgi:hypothetical protein